MDNADYPIGQIVVAQALADRQNGRSGNYGVTATASAAHPSPPPSPAPTTSPATQGTTNSTRVGYSPAYLNGHAMSAAARQPGQAPEVPVRARRRTAAGTAAASRGARAAYAAPSRRPPGGETFRPGPTIGASR